MSFFIYDITFLIIFSAFIAWFLYSRRKNLQREGLLYLYRTSFGIKAIEWTSSKFKKTLTWLQYVSIGLGYILMGTMLYLFFQLVWIYIKNPEIVRAVKIPPVMPLIPYLPSVFKLDFLPPFYFTYWIVILAVVAIVHEFAHGIFARLHNIKVKSTGFGFLGPFLAAFVEPDEEQMKTKSIKKQLSVLSAGTFANILTSIFFVFVFVLFFTFCFSPAGAVFDTYMYSKINISQIDSIEGIDVTNPSVSLIEESLDEENNFTKVSIGDESYFIANDRFLQLSENIEEEIIAYDDTPAFNSKLEGVIIEFNGEKISNHEDLAREISKYSPGDKIELKTDVNGEIKNYELTLDNYNGKAYIGIGLLNPSTDGIRGKIYSFLSLIKKPGTYYAPSIDGNLVIFIYDLLWWMILINISVALINMLPLGIFDGGRVFYLTILFFTKSENTAKKVFKFMTMFLLFLLLLIMFFWFISVF